MGEASLRERSIGLLGYLLFSGSFSNGLCSKSYFGSDRSVRG